MATPFLGVRAAVAPVALKNNRLRSKVMGFKYRKSVLEELARHGIVPREDSPPDLIRDYVNGLYLVEIRSLRAKMRAGQIQKKDYARLVAELRDRYPILSLRVALWAEERDE